MVELDAARQTTILFKLKLGEIVTTITTIGRKVETVEYNNLCFAMRSAGGQDKIQPRRRQFFRRVHGLVYTADSMTETGLRRQTKNSSKCRTRTRCAMRRC